MTANEILNLYYVGLISQDEATAKLNAIQVHGGFDTAGYTGYDYANPQWVTGEAA